MFLAEAGVPGPCVAGEVCEGDGDRVVIHAAVASPRRGGVAQVGVRVCAVREGDGDLAENVASCSRVLRRGVTRVTVCAGEV